MFPTHYQPFLAFDDGVFALDLYESTNTEEDACNFAALLPPGDQTAKNKFIPLAKYGNW